MKKLRKEEPRSMSEGGMRAFCILPALLLLIGLNVLPILATFAISFTTFDPLVDAKPVFAGIENYRQLFGEQEKALLPSFGRTGELVLVVVFVQTALGFGLALLLRRRFLGQGLLLSLLLIPMLLSPAVMATFWRYLLDADFGLINWLLGESWSWSGDESRAFWAVAIAEVWMWTPFMMLLSLAALSRIPDSLYEAAEVDRGGAWFRFRYITLPLTAKLVLLGVLFRAVDTFRLFDTPLALNGADEGRPTTTVSVLLFSRGFGGSTALGGPTAIASLILIVALVLAALTVSMASRARAREGLR